MDIGEIKRIAQETKNIAVGIIRYCEKKNYDDIKVADIRKSVQEQVTAYNNKYKEVEFNKNEDEFLDDDEFLTYKGEYKEQKIFRPKKKVEVNMVMGMILNLLCILNIQLLKFADQYQDKDSKKVEDYKRLADKILRIITAISQQILDVGTSCNFQFVWRNHIIFELCAAINMMMSSAYRVKKSKDLFNILMTKIKSQDANNNRPTYTEYDIKDVSSALWVEIDHMNIYRSNNKKKESDEKKDRISLLLRAGADPISSRKKYIKTNNPKVSIQYNISEHFPIILFFQTFFDVNAKKEDLKFTKTLSSFFDYYTNQKLLNDLKETLGTCLDLGFINKENSNILLIMIDSEIEQLNSRNRFGYGYSYGDAHSESESDCESDCESDYGSGYGSGYGSFHDYY